METEAPVKQGPRFKGQFHFRCYNQDGSLAWEEKIPNGNTNAGLNDILDVYFHSGTQKTTWYMGLIDNAGFSALSTADTMASHAGWTENQQYSGGARPTWTPGAPSGQSIANPATVNFTMTANATIYGAFLVSNNTLGGTTGTLWATGAFSSPQVLLNTQVLNVTYTCSDS